MLMHRHKYQLCMIRLNSESGPNEERIRFKDFTLLSLSVVLNIFLTCILFY